jgi:hypothetical protein
MSGPSPYVLLQLRERVSRVALVVAESSRCGFFPAITALRCFRTSLLNTQWNRRTKRPCKQLKAAKR